jgi:hypothetical protein
VRTRLSLLLTTACLSACAFKPYAPTDVWWDYCDDTIQAPADRVGVLSGSYFATPIAGELYGCLQAPTGGSLNEAYRVLYSVKLTDIRAGDIAAFNAYGELTNETYEDDVMVVWYFTLAGSYADAFGPQITEPLGYNITPGMHHGVVSQTAFYEFTQDHTEVYLNFVVYAAASGDFINVNLAIEPGYGGITGTLLRAETPDIEPSPTPMPTATPKQKKDKWPKKH